MKLKKIAEELGIQYSGDIDISGLNTLKDASGTQLSFLENKKYQKDLQETKAAAVFINEELKDLVPKGTIALITPEPYIALAKASRFFAPLLIEEEGDNPVIGEDTTIMPNAYIGKNSVIGRNCTIMSGAFIGDNVTIGKNSVIYPNVTVYRDCKIGDNTIIHAGTVIGSDGFGFANTKEGKYIKIYQNGNVTVGNDVEIGSNCTVDRAAFNSTVIEDGVRIDNLVHIAHNCIIGRGSILVSQVGLSGSTKLNHYVVMGGQSGASGHLEIAPFTTIAARGGVTKSITEPKKQWAGFPLKEHKTWLKLQSKISKLLK
jgi:UDP-3-O-[3-hydroxymyristoyl] glucosamine N-acyltransferase